MKLSFVAVGFAAFVVGAAPASAAWQWVYVGNSDCAAVDAYIMQGSTSPSSFEMARMCSQNFHPYPGNAAICRAFGTAARTPVCTIKVQDAASCIGGPTSSRMYICEDVHQPAETGLPLRSSRA